MTHHNLTDSSSTEQSPASDGRDNIQDLLKTPEALEAYLAEVRQRRERHQEQRQREYWRSAIVRLKEELDAARADQDEEIAAELQAVLASFKTALASTSIPTVAEKDISQHTAEPPPVAEARVVTALKSTGSNGTHPAVTVAHNLVSVPAPLDEAAQAELAARCQTLCEQILAHLDDENGDLTHALRSRALFCEGQALGLNPNTPESGRQSLTDPLDDLTAAPSPWADGYPFSLRQHDFTVWNELARLYDECALASEFLDWYQACEGEVPEDARLDVLNAISAVQQRLYRSPDGTGRRDDAVHELYRRIRLMSQNTGFIRALSQSVGDAELQDLAARCGSVVADVKSDVEERRARAVREASKDAAVAAIIAWEESLEGRVVTSDSLEADRQSLCSLLDNCLVAGVSPTNLKVRAAILDTAPVLLDGLLKYAKFLDAVNAERAKRSLDAVGIEPPQAEVRDEDLTMLVQQVADFTRSKHIIMLGGKNRPQVAQELSKLLECDVAWLDSDRGDKFGKFSSAVKKADVVLLLKNYASHEIFYGSKEAMAADGKHFVVLPSGYGVKQVVFQLSEYVARQKVTA